MTKKYKMGPKKDAKSGGGGGGASKGGKGGKAGKSGGGGGDEDAKAAPKGGTAVKVNN